MSDSAIRLEMDAPSRGHVRAPLCLQRSSPMETCFVTATARKSKAHGDSFANSLRTRCRANSSATITIGVFRTAVHGSWEPTLTRPGAGPPSVAVVRPQLVECRSSLGAGVDPQLCEQVVHVILHGVNRDGQIQSDLLVRPA